jgi:DNA polymerase-1
MEIALIGVEDEEVRDGIMYFYSEEAQAALKAAADTKKQYFAQFPGIKQFIKDAGDAAARRGYIKTWVGSRRHFKDPRKESYKAPNACIQGGCGYVLKDRLPHLAAALYGTRSKIVNLVHDECAFMIHNDELALIPELNKILTDLPFRVPITWGIEVGQRWGSKQDYEEEEIEEDEVG